MIEKLALEAITTFTGQVYAFNKIAGDKVI